MKILLLALTLSIPTLAFAEGFEECTHAHFKILEKAEGPKKNLVDELIYLETPNFSCEVKTEYRFFPADCNRFTFNELEYRITVAGKKLTAKVNDGRISCTKITKTVLVNAVVTE